MGFNVRTYATVTYWTEYRNPSGRWSKAKYDLVECVYDSAGLEAFFTEKMPSERWTYAPWKGDYLPSRVSVPSSDGSERVVYVFEYQTTEE